MAVSEEHAAVLAPLESDLLRGTGRVHGFFTRQGGRSSGLYKSLNIGLGSRDTRASVVENRARVARHLGVRYLLSPHQTHSATAVAVSAPFMPDEAPIADALVTATPGLAVGVSTADCGPVLFCSRNGQVVGAAHAGWRGAFDGILEATVALMARFGAAPSEIIAVLGPTISAAVYEVGQDFCDRFVAADPDNARFFSPSLKTVALLNTPSPNGVAFDLPAYLRARLMAAGVGFVDDVGRCTYQEEDLFFSYRRACHQGAADYGRLMSAIAISPSPGDKGT